MNSSPLAVYRLMPSARNLRTLRLDDSLIGLKRWQFQGDRAPRPTAFAAEWTGDPKARKAEFASDYPGAPILGGRLADRLRGDLEASGPLLPVRVAESPADTYLLHLVDRIVDCVDTRASSRPKKVTGEMQKTVFRPDALPLALPSFRVPQFPVGVQWNGWAVERLTELLGADLESRLVWSEDPDATPHPAPWGLLV
ncbi:hypothetical protein ACH4S8_39440 [Streptomyces sp. NPDC021080]|uniref:hypothetical protein n=1 Tax=Streptomyces sp. NPDC021080 TaxID=3365110 RepID=UPI00379BC0DC